MKIYAEKVPALVFFCLSILFTPAFASASQKPLMQQQAKAHPSIQVPDPDYNFGTAVQGATVEHVFIVFNRGKQTLKIEHVKVS